MGVLISKIEYYLPQKNVSNDDFAKINPDWDMDKIEAKSGIKKRHFAEKDETALDLSIKAIDKMFESNNIKNEIDAIIYCTQSPDYIMPSNSFLIHKHFSFDEKVWTFDYNLACSGFIYGLAIIRGLIGTSLAKKILLINAETYSKYISSEDRSTSVLFGDAAAVTLIESDEYSESIIIDILLASSGEKSDFFCLKNGGARMKNTDFICDDNQNYGLAKKDEMFIKMNGFAVWQFITHKVPIQIMELLVRNNKSINDIDLFIFHQASKLTIDSLAKVLMINNDKLFCNMVDIGNTVSASIPIAIKDAADSGRLKRGNLIILSGFGVGLSWGSVLMKY